MRFKYLVKLTDLAINLEFQMMASIPLGLVLTIRHRIQTFSIILTTFNAATLTEIFLKSYASEGLQTSFKIRMFNDLWRIYNLCYKYLF